jgi:hypothetical protein
MEGGGNEMVEKRWDGGEEMEMKMRGGKVRRRWEVT